MAKKYWFQQLKFFDWIVLALLAAIAWAVWYGFSFRNPYMSDNSNLKSLIPLALQLLCYPAFFGAMFLYVKVRTGKLKLSIALILPGSFLVLALIAYFPLEIFYMSKRMDKVQSGIMKSIRFHPYLQLSPPRFEGKSPKPEREYRILCLGGSTTEFSDTKGRGWPERVEARLQKKNENVRVYNIGRQWYTTLHTLINYETNLRDHNADVVVVMHTINDFLHNADFSDFSVGEFREDYGNFYGPLRFLLLDSPTVFGKVSNILSNSWYYFDKRKVVTQTEFPGLIPFKRNLGTLIDLAEKDGVSVVLMTQPSLFRPDLTMDEQQKLYMLNMEAVGKDKRWDLKTAVTGFKLYSDSIRQLAADRNIQLIDLEKLVAKKTEYFADDVHYSDMTFDIIAEKVASGLIVANYFQRISEVEQAVSE